jgi:hypothetical protein
VQETSIEQIVQDFVDRLTTILTADAQERARETLMTALGGGQVKRRGPGRPPKADSSSLQLSPAAPPKRRKLPASPEAMRARRIQGQYLGSLRRLKGANRARVKKLAKEKGVPEAVKLAAQLSG